MAKRLEKTPPIFGRQYELTWKAVPRGWEASWFPKDEKGARYLVYGRGYVLTDKTTWDVHLVLYQPRVQLSATSTRLPRAIAKLEQQLSELETSVALAKHGATSVQRGR